MPNGNHHYVNCHPEPIDRSFSWFILFL